MPGKFQFEEDRTEKNHLKNEGRKLSKETIYHYLEAAKSSYLVYGVPRYNIKGKEIMKINEKYFVNDLGIRHLYFANEKEVDFIAIEGARKIYIQVAYLLAEQSTIEREFSILEAIDDNYIKIVISMDKVNRSRNGILHKNIIDFLMEDE